MLYRDLSAVNAILMRPSIDGLVAWPRRTQRFAIYLLFLRFTHRLATRVDLGEIAMQPFERFLALAGQEPRGRIAEVWMPLILTDSSSVTGRPRRLSTMRRWSGERFLTCCSISGGTRPHYCRSICRWKRWTPDIAPFVGGCIGGINCGNKRRLRMS
jgi:hypothetical protein